jgi:hypothetical protein
MKYTLQYTFFIHPITWFYNKIITFNLEVVGENEGEGVMKKLTLSPTHPSTLSIIRSRDCGVATQILLKNIFDKYYLSLNKVNYYFFSFHLTLLMLFLRFFSCYSLYVVFVCYICSMCETRIFVVRGRCYDPHLL